MHDTTSWWHYITSPLCLSPGVGEKKSIYVDGEGEVENLGDN